MKAMREALENSNGLLEELAVIGEWGESAREQIAENNASLSAPPRNCDRFNTGNPMKDAEDAYGAWQRYCDDPTMPPSCKVESAFKNWLFAPATEQEGDTDGSK